MNETKNINWLLNLVNMWIVMLILVFKKPDASRHGGMNTKFDIQNCRFTACWMMLFQDIPLAEQVATASIFLHQVSELLKYFLPARVSTYQLLPLELCLFTVDCLKKKVYRHFSSIKSGATVISDSWDSWKLLSYLIKFYW